MIEVESGTLTNLVKQLSRIEGDADEAQVLAVNRAARDGRVLGAAQIYSEVAYPNGYLNKDRLRIAKHARKGDPEATIVGRDRATLLSRFRTSRVRFGRQHGVTVRVDPAQEVNMESAFFLPLHNGNIGLAVRVKPGQHLRNSGAAKPLGKGVYLLYGPSVNQAFRGVAADIVDDVTSIMRTEFLRQFRRLKNGR